MSAIFLFPVCLTYWPRKYTTRVDPTLIIRTKFDATTPIRSRVTSYNVSIGYQWKCVRGHCTCAESRDQCVWGQKTITFFWIPDPDLPIHYTTFLGATTTIKGRLLSSRPMLKPFLGEKIPSPVEMGPKNGGFWKKMGVETLGFGFAIPKRHFLARNCVVWRILRQNQRARLDCSLSQVPPAPKK